MCIRDRNSVEKIEKSKNSQLAREIEVALPKELDREKQINLVREYVKENFVKVGMCADIALHDKNDGNPHCHILLTMRPLNEDTTGGAKSKKEYILDENGEKVKLKNGNYKTRKINTTDWNEQDKAEEWRKAWADITNKYLEENSIQEKVDHRSYQRQGIEQIPTLSLIHIFYNQILEIREEVEQAEKVKTCIEQLQEHEKQLSQVKRIELDL